MSRPANVLSKFQTYSYHHILIATVDTESVYQLSQAPIESFMRKTSDRFGGTVSDTKDGTANSLGQPYIVLINSMVDADYIIDDVTWSAVVAQIPDADNNLEAAMSLATEGSIKILEPAGAQFLSLLTDTFDSLQCDPNGVQFLLKTIFVGHTDDENGRTEVMTNLKPLPFWLIDLKSEHNEVGSTYDIQFVGSNNGASKIPHFMNVMDGMSSFKTTMGQLYQATGNTDVTKGSTGVLNDFETMLNDTYNANIEELRKSLAPQGIDPLEYGKRIRYSIEAHEHYTDSSYMLTSIDPQATADATSTSLPFPVSRGDTIERVIYKILKSCKGVQNDATGDGRQKGVKIIPKIHTTIMANTDKDDAYLVRFMIAPFIVRDDVIKAAERLEHTKFAPGGQFERDVLHLDYIFTGKNVDVLNFEMKVELGLLFLQSAFIPSNISSSGFTPTSANNVQEQGSPNRGSLSYTNRKYTPIPGAKGLYDSIIAHSRTPQKAAIFDDMLRRHASLEAMGTTIRIVGNPSLLADTLVLPNEIGRFGGQAPNETSSPDQRTYIEDNLGTHVATDWQRRPVVVKVNVFMPKETENGIELIPFWYDGYFRVLAVKHEFAKGEFTQVLELLSMPQFVETDSIPDDIIGEPTIAQPTQQAAATEIDYQMQISKHYKLQDVSIAAAVTKNTIQPQHGLTNEQIIANLTYLAVNVIDPITDKFGHLGMTVNSVFRNAATGSQHEFGEAVDVQFSAVEKADYVGIAEWIRVNIPLHDQLLLEWKTTGTGNPWIHVSLKLDTTSPRGDNRKRHGTFMNHKAKVWDELRDMSTE